MTQDKAGRMGVEERESVRQVGGAKLWEQRGGAVWAPPGPPISGLLPPTRPPDWFKHPHTTKEAEPSSGSFWRAVLKGGCSDRAGR